MVFTSLVTFIRARGPDEFWRKRKIFKLSAHYIGRRRNCYSIAIKNVHRALAYATLGRKLKKEDLTQLRDIRIAAGCEQYGLELNDFRDSLVKNNILLNRKTLADLAIWEPRSFETLIKITEKQEVDDLCDKAGKLSIGWTKVPSGGSK
uniref:Putative ribosomal protein l20 n=1 Tax=Tabanus bromius TaxID=304241 RepID=A0A0K8TPB0_TABBR